MAHAGVLPFRKEHSSHTVVQDKEHTPEHAELVCSERCAAWAGVRGAFHAAFPHNLAERHDCTFKVTTT